MSDHEHHADENHPAERHVHILPIWIYGAVFSTLIAGTIITVAASQDIVVNATDSLLGDDTGNLVTVIVAMIIATIKASLVCLIFMHLLWDNKFYSIILVLSLIFLATFITFCIFDLDYRGEVNYSQRDNIQDIQTSAPAFSIIAKEHEGFKNWRNTGKQYLIDHKDIEPDKSKVPHGKELISAVLFSLFGIGGDDHHGDSSGHDTDSHDDTEDHGKDDAGSDETKPSGKKDEPKADEAAH
ncbi:MAG: cytochrome C oxidase subunit IV family protein [Lentisphaeria bacterium]|nr:cytochrome C oxidase subunit IV family protein [Lentisphaeria bacterium]NQZ69118.1 cytochrome C oxidase subunit IV family protein [Lentisphaeria bacterium]